MFEPITNVLPADFDGIVRFTNATEEDFVGKWGKKNYTFPAMKTTPMVIVDATPLELFGIRKKFAKDLAEREFFKSNKYKSLTAMEKNRDNNAPQLNSIHQANTYSLDELAPYIQKCLEPLSVGKATVTEQDFEKTENKLHTDEEGNLITKAVDKNLSLKERALSGKGL
jgi:hypothetical protein